MKSMWIFLKLISWSRESISTIIFMRTLAGHELRNVQLRRMVMNSWKNFAQAWSFVYIVCSIRDGIRPDDNYWCSTCMRCRVQMWKWVSGERRGAGAGGRAGAAEALPRARARYAVAPVLLATRIFYTPHIINIVVVLLWCKKYQNSFKIL